MKITSICLGTLLTLSFASQSLLGTDMYVGVTGTSPYGTTPYSSPTTFQFNSDATLLAEGTFGTGSAYTLTASTRMMWYPKAAAFRAGYASTTGWNTANMGSYSVAFGYNCLAGGSYSSAFGNGSSAGGSYATAVGNGSNAGGQASFVFGYGCLADHPEGVAGGFQSKAYGQYAVALGCKSEAYGVNSVAMGYFALSNTPGCMAVGNYNLGLGSPTVSSTTDPILEVGNGNSIARSNALTVLKNGNAIVSGVVTAAPGGDIPMFQGY